MTDLADLAARITALEDIEAIKRLKYEYFFFCDQKQPEKVRDCFVEGPVEIDYGRVGVFNNREELYAVFDKLACVPHIVEMHHAQNPQIDLQGPDSASAIWGLYYYMINTNDQTVTQLGAYYEDEYRKVDGNWKISATRCVVTSTTLLSLADGAVQALFAGTAAPAEIDDPARQAE